MSGEPKRFRRGVAKHFPRLAVAARYVRARKKRFIALFVTTAHVVGALTSVQAVMSTRTAQGATAWAVALNAMPYVAVPAYWVFGSTKFDGYVTKRRGEEKQAHPIIGGFIEAAKEKSLLATGYGEPANRLTERLARLPATTGNDVELLRNGEEIFPSIFEGIDKAEHYILIQFFIVRDDTLGRELHRKLLAAAKRGVGVHFVYDEIGSQSLTDTYVDELRVGGVEMIPFNTRQGITNRFQLNFRNHRKVVITDGRAAWVGGANVGDEYMHRDEDHSPWHDTMIKLTGPSVQTVQVSFWEDWLWASGKLLELQWEPQAAPSGGQMEVLCVPSGPADKLETYTLYFLQMIQSAKERLWIASPYFVPDEQIITALELAALRGVEIRIFVPEKAEDPLVDLSGWAFVPRLGKVGVRFYRHTSGFMHQKVAVVDSERAVIGSANLDNRSFRLNFEMTMEIRDEAFTREVSEMLERDFSEARLVDPDELEERGFLFRLKVRAANLLSPIQ